MQYLTTAEYNAPEIAKANGNIATFAGGQNGPLGWRDAKYIHPSLNGIIVVSRPLNLKFTHIHYIALTLAFSIAKG